MRTIPRTGLVVAVLASALALACKAKHPVVPEGASRTWPEMNDKERAQHMGAVVLPRMKASFQQFDAERFADFSCGTCHGAGAEDGSFEMPNPGLPRLDPSGLYKKHRKATPEIADFMWKEVEPEMAELLGLPRYSFVKKSGFGCANCHLVEGE
jgi:cytochrome c553